MHAHVCVCRMKTKKPFEINDFFLFIEIYKQLYSNVSFYLKIPKLRGTVLSIVYKLAGRAYGTKSLN